MIALRFRVSGFRVYGFGQSVYQQPPIHYSVFRIQGIGYRAPSVVVPARQGLQPFDKFLSEERAAVRNVRVEGVGVLGRKAEEHLEAA
jgi:hypothetical protein